MSELFSPWDEEMMGLALQCAKQAFQKREIPVGAVIVKGEKIIAQSGNAVLGAFDPTSHAEIAVIRLACGVLKTHRLDGCTLYVTLEPCVMCSGAVFAAHLSRVVYGAPESKTGAAGSIVDLYSHQQINYHTKIIGGLFAVESRSLLQQFFSQIRQEKKDQENKQQLTLRQDMLRSQEENCQRFIPAVFSSHYDNQWRVVNQLRLHYLKISKKIANKKLTEENFAMGGKRSNDKREACLPALIMIPPFPLWSAWYFPLIKEVAKDNQEIYILDRLGCGLSDKPKKFSDDWVCIEHELVLEWIVSLKIKTFSLFISTLDSTLLAMIKNRFGASLNSVFLAQFSSDEKNIATTHEWILAPFETIGHANFAFNRAFVQVTSCTDSLCDKSIVKDDEDGLNGGTKNSIRSNIKRSYPGLIKRFLRSKIRISEIETGYTGFP